ncbi:hypothetical protein AN396_12285 [Candidatus Epulonipiscium fishelsonii]|uniref:Uncharacterized protein n=1 Tax=Candidatus Epulonipiscium fishelsonii TaxID=77094 RepID=A0ACC8X7V4_9FIRM|nr:hypothetical protein AN396_12285 [Epulopiscium sp. SCG-B11WGA-EpuloA1]
MDLKNIFMIKGDGAYSKLKYESGVHRVQRIPTTESCADVFTSTVTFAVFFQKPKKLMLMSLLMI